MRGWPWGTWGCAEPSPPAEGLSMTAAKRRSLQSISTSSGALECRVAAGVAEHHLLERERSRTAPTSTSVSISSR